MTHYGVYNQGIIPLSFKGVKGKPPCWSGYYFSIGKRLDYSQFIIHDSLAHEATKASLTVERSHLYVFRDCCISKYLMFILLVVLGCCR